MHFINIIAAHSAYSSLLYNMLDISETNEFPDHFFPGDPREKLFFKDILFLKHIINPVNIRRKLLSGETYVPVLRNPRKDVQ